MVTTLSERLRCLAGSERVACVFTAESFKGELKFSEGHHSVSVLGHEQSIVTQSGNQDR